MESSITEKHIFNDCELYFEKKIRSFHNKYVEFFLLIGVDKPNKNFSEVKMTKNPLYSLLYYQRIVGGVESLKSLINVTHLKNSVLTCEFDIFYLNNNQDIENFYMTQTIHNWDDNPNLTSYQIWQINSSNIFDLNNHWL